MLPDYCVPDKIGDTGVTVGLVTLFAIIFISAGVLLLKRHRQVSVYTILGLLLTVSLLAGGGQ